MGYTYKELQDLVSFSRNEIKLKDKTIVDKWIKQKMNKISNEEKNLFKDYKIGETKINDDASVLLFENMSQTSDRIIREMLKKLYKNDNYHIHYDIDHGNYWHNFVLIIDKDLSLNQYKDDKYMTYLENDCVTLISGSDICDEDDWSKEELEKERKDKYCLDGISSEYKQKNYSVFVSENLYSYNRLLINYDRFPKLEKAIDFINKKI